MQVILLEKIKKLGKLGDIVKVKNGFARNFLIPKSMAMKASKEALLEYEQKKSELEVLMIQKNGILVCNLKTIY